MYSWPPNGAITGADAGVVERPKPKTIQLRCCAITIPPVSEQADSNQTQARCTVDRLGTVDQLVGGNVTGIEIREAVSAEEREAAGKVTALAYADFAASFHPEEWADWSRILVATGSRAEDGALLIAVDENARVLGTVTLYLDPRPTSWHWRPDDAMIGFLAVRPDRRRKGIGKLLLAETIDRSLRAGKHRLALQTAPYMNAARTLYLRAGFVRDSDGDFKDSRMTLLGFALDLTAARTPS